MLLSDIPVALSLPRLVTKHAAQLFKLELQGR